MRISMLATAVLSISALSACSTTPPTSSSVSTSAPPGVVKAAQVMMTAKSGSNAVGTLSAQSMGDGVMLSGRLTGLPPSRSLGFHIHEVGDCSAADASSAGGHFNPTGQPHGNVTMPAPHHLGDQMNLKTDASGLAVVSAHFSGVTLGTGQANDVNGKAVVVHADPDDYSSQPAGNAGARIACGVIGR